MVKRQWGIPVATLVIAACLTADAGAQLVGGQAQQAPDPSTVDTSPTAIVMGNDPMAGVNFSACENVAALQAQMPNSQLMQNASQQNPYTAAASAIGGALGGGAAGAIGGASSGNALNGGLSGAGNGALQGAFGVTQSCAEIPQDITLPQCPQHSSNGRFNSAPWDAAQSQIVQAQGVAACRIAQSQRAATVTDCMAREFENLRNALNSTKRDFDTIVNSKEQWAQGVRTIIQTEEQKRDGLSAKVQSLGDIKNRVETLLRTMNGAVQGEAGRAQGNTISGLQIQLNQQRDGVRAFSLRQRSERANRVRSCFMGNGASTSNIHVCPNGGGELMSPRECILSVYRSQQASAISGNSRVTTGGDRRQAEVRTRVLDQRLTQLLGDFYGPNPRTTSADAFQQSHGAELQQYGVAGQQILIEVQNCDREIQGQIQTELSNPDTDLGRDARALNSASMALSSSMGTMINDLDTTMRDTAHEIFGAELGSSFSGFGCTNSVVSRNQNAGGQIEVQQTSLDQQLTCIKGLNANLQAILNDQVMPGSTASLHIQVTAPGMEQPLQCSGLRSCIAAATLEKTRTETKLTNLRGEGTFTDARNGCSAGCPGLHKFFHDTNVNLRQAIQHSADQFQRRVEVAKVQLERLRTLLGNNNLGSALPRTTGEGVDVNTICPDSSESVCHIPQDFGASLGKLAGVPNIEPSAFDQAKQQAQQGVTTATQRMSAFQGQLTALQNAMNECRAQVDDRNSRRRVARVRGDYNSRLARCQAAARRLDHTQVQNFSDHLADLQSSLASVCASASDGSSEDCSALQSTMLEGDSTCAQVENDERTRRESADTTYCETQLGAQPAQGAGFEEAMARRQAMRAACLRCRQESTSPRTCDGNYRPAAAAPAQ